MANVPEEIILESASQFMGNGISGSGSSVTTNRVNGFVPGVTTNGVERSIPRVMVNGVVANGVGGSAAQVMNDGVSRSVFEVVVNGVSRSVARVEADAIIANDVGGSAAHGMTNGASGSVFEVRGYRAIAVGFRITVSRRRERICRLEALGNCQYAIDTISFGNECSLRMWRRGLNYVPWSSRLLRYAKSRPNGKLIYNSIMNGLYVKRMIPEPGDADREVKADDQAIQTILLGLPEDIYAAVDSCETAQEIWLRVHQMMKGSDIGIQEKKAKLTKGLNTADYTQLYDFLKYNQKKVVQNAVQNPGVQNVGNQNGLIVVSGIANQNPNGNGNVVAARAEGNAIRNNGNQIRCYNCRGLGHLPRNCTVRLRRRDAAYLQTQLLIAQKEEAGI
ncbi:integrase, catalytic region, zinc finger, CCHC-type containing protein [Tanacetum coccineum]|uniref:Integrase, catalytic region, zinc finger, CCHC-type containing protein n=1 Tax=Tanacetum coccineum TaxID=301880 RepID=A0ABQ5D6Z0_9ASTR